MSDKKLLLYKDQNKIVVLRIGAGRLHSVQVYDEADTAIKDNIYIGKIIHLRHNINAAFIDVQKDLNCFLSLERPLKSVYMLNRPYDGRLLEGDELIVQVSKEAVKTKIPVVTTDFALSGRYLAISVGAGKLRFSKKLSEEKQYEIEEFLHEAGYINSKRVILFPHRKLADGDTFEEGAPLDTWDIIVRTNSRSLTDFSPLMMEWERLCEEKDRLLADAHHRTCFSCLKKAQHPYLEDLKDYYTEDIDEIVTDCEDIYEDLKHYEEEQCALGALLPPIRLYQDEYPMSKLYQLEKRLKEALNSTVWLKSGAYLVIEHTEAMTVIDVNAGRFVKKNIQSQDTFFSVNMEAAKEIALQMKLRNMSGIIIVDFINMESDKMKEILLERMRELTAMDSVKTEVVDITPLGLVEITRQRINKPLRELFQQDEKGAWVCK